MVSFRAVALLASLAQAGAFLAAGAQPTAGALLAAGVQPARAPLRRSSPRMSGDEPEEAAAKGPPPTRPGMYDLSKLQNTDGGGFNKFDPVLSISSFVSRRFGIVGGLAVVAALAATEGREIFNSFTATGPVPGSGERVTLPGGLSYVDLLVGTQGGTVLPGNIIGFHAVVSVGGQQLFDTHSDKPIAYTYGKRPFPSLVCVGVEDGIRGMKVGGVRRLSIPQALAPEGVKLPPNVDLTYDVELTEILTNYF